MILDDFFLYRLQSTLRNTIVGIRYDKKTAGIFKPARQPMKPDGPVGQPYSYSIPSPHILF
jgi:hypothetical protein